MLGFLTVAIAAFSLATWAIGNKAGCDEHPRHASDGDCSRLQPWTTEDTVIGHQVFDILVEGSSMLQSETQVALSQMVSQDVAEHKFNGTVCFFVSTDTAPEDTDGRARAAVTAETWAAKPAARSYVYYLVDESLPPYHLPASVQPKQIIKTLRTSYEDLWERTQSLLVQINTKRLLNKCDWFALVDDDTYVNTASVVAKAGHLDASGLHYMGAVCRVSDYGHGIVNMIHGSFKMFSAAAVPVIAEVAAQCRLWRPGAWEDFQIARCLKNSGFNMSLRAEGFGNYIHNNTKVARPNTLQQALDQSHKAKSSLACLDFLHKMLPDDMRTFHDHLRRSPMCINGPAALLSVAA